MNSSFIAPHRYRKCLTHLVAEEESLDVAVAFWGAGAEKLIHPDRTKTIRIVCNLRTGGTNPAVIEHFLELSRNNDLDVQIRQCDQLHAKVIIGKNQAVIGSANMSTNGLGLEDSDSARWLEAGMYIKERPELDDMRAWFDSFWSSDQVRTIEDDDINAAYNAWYHKPSMLSADAGLRDFSLADFTVSSLRRTKAYALIYRHDLSLPAKKQLSAIQSELVAPQHDVKTGIKLWGYEDWPNFPTDISAEYVDIHWSSKNNLHVFGSCRLLGQRATVRYNESEIGTLDIANPVQTLLGLQFGKKAKERMQKDLKRCIEKVWGDGDDHSVRVIHLADIAEALYKTVEAKPSTRRISGKEAVQVLASLSDQVLLRKKDNTDKFWCYKLTSRKGTEFAFDPNTTDGLYVRLDRQPPHLRGVIDAEKILGNNMSTALDRVFSGGIHKAAYQVTIESESALRDFVDYLMDL